MENGMYNEWSGFLHNINNILCENEMLNFSMSYFDQLELKNTKIFVDTEISLT